MRGWRRHGDESADLEGVVKEIADICRRYRLPTVNGDRYAAAWIRERFRAEGIRYLEPECQSAERPHGDALRR
jgi:hypothetical protein